MEPSPRCPRGRRACASTATASPGSASSKRKGVKKTAGSWKAKKAEKLIRLYMESLGFLVHQAVSTGVKRGPIFTSQSNDLFHVFDLWGLRYGEKDWCVQVTTLVLARAKRRKIVDAVGAIIDTNHHRVEVFAPYSFRVGRRTRVQVRVWELHGMGWHQRIEDLVIPDEIVKALTSRTGTCKEDATC